MPTHVWGGALLAMLGGVMMGNLMFPFKYVRHWRWENVWLVFSIFSQVLVPWALAVILVPNLGSVYSQVRWAELAVPFLFGAGWGVANVFFGRSVIYIGMALSFAITTGLSAVLGTLVPLIFQHDQAIDSTRVFWITVGVLMMLAGTVACSWVGYRRELAGKFQADQLNARKGTGTYKLGLGMAIFAGFLAPMLNYALAFGTEVMREAERFGALPSNAPYAVWPIALGGGLLANGGYSIYLLSSNRAWENFHKSKLDFVYSSFMGVLFMGAVAVYGMGTTYLGRLGSSIGWALFEILIIIAANVSGFIVGEWPSLAKNQKVVLWSGLGLLAMATVVLARSTH